MSYVDANRGRVVTFTDDVLGIKRAILDRWPGWAERRFGALNVEFDNEAEEWIILQIEKNGTESLVFATKCLDQRVIERLQRADQAANNGVDFAEEIDKENERLERERERRFEEQIADATERLVHAFKKDGLIIKPSVFIPNK